MRSLVVLFALVAVATAAPYFGHAVAYSVPAAVSHQSRVDVKSSPALVAAAPVEVASVIAEPVIAARTVVSPAVYTGASAVSHQSRVDVHSSPAVVATAPVTSVIAEPVVAARAVVAPAVYSGASAVSHQSRVDVHSSPAVVASAPVVAPAPVITEQVVAAPAVVEARSVYAAPVATAYYGGAAVSQQSRIDVESSPAVISEHVVAPALYSAW